MTLDREAIRRYALDQLEVDKVGFASIDRFRDAPADMHPRNILPSVRTVIVFIKRILRGGYRGIDQGTHWPSYTIFNYNNLNDMLGFAGYEIARYIEGHGFDATGISSASTVREVGPRGPRPAPDLPPPEVILHFRLAATLAGLGEIGWSKVFLTEEFGPRQRIGIVLTDAELEPDPIRIGRLCDRCKRCVTECPAAAIAKDRSVKIEVDGHVIEWGDLDLGKCKLTHFGFNRRTAPFLVKQFPGFYVPIAEQSVTWKEAWDLGWCLFPGVPSYQTLGREGVPALCGARGCMIGCMKHMEQKQAVGNRFRVHPVFSKGKPWSLPERPQPADHNGFIYDPADPLDPDTQRAAASYWY